MKRHATHRYDCHSYWEFNEYTRVFPLHEQPFTGGAPGSFAARQQYNRASLFPGSGPSGVSNQSVPKLVYGDDPNNPRDPDRGPNASPTDPDRPTVNNDDEKETRLRFVPNGVANEILLDIYVRVAPFEPAVHDRNQRLFDAYAAEVARVDTNADGVISFVEGDAENIGRAAEQATVPACNAVQPIRRHARDQRRLARAALCTQSARIRAERHHCARATLGAGVRRARRRRPIGSVHRRDTRRRGSAPRTLINDALSDFHATRRGRRTDSLDHDRVAAVRVILAGGIETIAAGASLATRALRSTRTR